MNENIITPDLFVQGLSSKYELQPRCIPHDSNRNSSLLQTNHVANWTALLPQQESRRFHEKKTPWNEEPASLICEILMLGNMFHGFSFWGDHFCSPIFQGSKLCWAFCSMARYPGIRYFCRKKNMLPRGPRYTIKIWSCGRCGRWTTFFFLNATPHRLSHPRYRKQVPPPLKTITTWQWRCIPCWKWSCSIVMLVFLGGQVNGSPPKLLDLSFTHPQSVVKKSTLNKNKSEKKRNTQQFFQNDSRTFCVPKKKSGAFFFGGKKKGLAQTQESHRVLGIPTNSAWAVTNLCVPQNPWWKKITSFRPTFSAAVRSQHLQVGVPYMLPF